MQITTAKLQWVDKLVGKQQKFAGKNISSGFLMDLLLQVKPLLDIHFDGQKTVAKNFLADFSVSSSFRKNLRISNGNDLSKNFKRENIADNFRWKFLCWKLFPTTYIYQEILLKTCKKKKNLKICLKLFLYLQERS